MTRTGPFAGCSLEGGGLVLDGRTVKVHLQRLAGSHGPVHIDWLRFSVPKDAVLNLGQYRDSDDSLFQYEQTNWDEQTRMHRMRKQIEHVTLDHSALAGARILGRELIQALGPDFCLVDQPQLGRDFFAFRLPILRNGVEVGWVGGGASSAKPQQQKQAAVLHVNLYGEACLFITREAMQRIGQTGQRYGGHITRCDLALDFFDGLPGGMHGLEAAYLAGDMDVRGKRPKVGHAGDWINVRACTFYLGSRDAGKYTRIYAKGDQLFGLEANDRWTRVELQWGDQLRVLPWEMLSDPAPYFAGASDYHAHLLGLAVQQQPEPQPIKCTPRAADATAEGAAFRALAWLQNTAKPAMSLVFRSLGQDEFLALVDGLQLPGRLKRFKPDEVASGLARAAQRFFNGHQGSPALAHG